MSAGLAGAPRPGAQEEPVTLWVLPLDNRSGDPALDDLARALSDLLTLAFACSSDCAVVDREHLAAVLEEQSLPAAGLAEPGTRRALGRLLGARWILHGSLARRGTKLWIATHLTELESTRILASEQVEADPSQLAQMLPDLAGKLLRAVRITHGGGAAQEIDLAPVANLHFLRGLGHYYSGQYHRALAEFLRSAAEPGLAGPSALWRANCYLGLEKYEHAFLELTRLRAEGSHQLDPEVLKDRIERCRKNLSAEDIDACERLLKSR